MAPGAPAQVVAVTITVAIIMDVCKILAADLEVVMDIIITIIAVAILVITIITLVQAVALDTMTAQGIASIIVLLAEVVMILLIREIIAIHHEIALMIENVRDKMIIDATLQLDVEIEHHRPLPHQWFRQHRHLTTVILVEQIQLAIRIVAQTHATIEMTPLLIPAATGLQWAYKSVPYALVTFQELVEICRHIIVVGCAPLY